MLKPPRGGHKAESAWDCSADGLWTLPIACVRKVNAGLAPNVRWQQLLSVNAKCHTSQRKVPVVSKMPAQYFILSNYAPHAIQPWGMPDFQVQASGGGFVFNDGEVPHTDAYYRLICHGN